MHDPVDEHTDLNTFLIFCVMPAAVAVLLAWIGFRGCL